MGCKLAVISAQRKDLHSLQVLIKSPLTFAHPALQNKLQFRNCVGEVTSVTPILLKTGQAEHPPGQGGNMVTKESPMLKADAFVSDYFTREL